MRLLVTVKTYPTLSRSYGETVCTAGLREDGSWVRLYPVPFRRLEEPQQYKKFDWIECNAIRSTRDPRQETYHPTNLADIHPVGHVGTEEEWAERRRLVLQTARVHTGLAEPIEGAHQNRMSLALFKPTRILDLIVEEEEREWDPERVAAMRAQHRQLDLFEDRSWAATFQVLRKMPYSFSYRFQDAEGRQSEFQILDWEIGALYWNCLADAGGDEETAIAKVREKYLDEFLRKDLHFFLGTTQRFHAGAPNPWVIVGVFPIPSLRQLRMF